MNARQLIELGVPRGLIGDAFAGIAALSKAGSVDTDDLEATLRALVAGPAAYIDHAQFGRLAASLVAHGQVTPVEPIEYRVWGQDLDAGSHEQIRNACALPIARKAALMPDAHIGYGLPIGGVLACENAVIPYAVGVDIACRMKMSILDVPISRMAKRPGKFEEALEQGTRFGVGVGHETRQQHAVMDHDWNVSPITRRYKDRAWKQLGTSGSGNHFAEFGVLTVPTGTAAALGLEPGEYVTLLSHSGSRGTGAAVCSHYSSLAKEMLPRQFKDVKHLAWLDMDSEPGREYWAAMNLMGHYASANHAVLHRLVTGILGAEVVAGVENHHNFAWMEEHDGRTLVVHRKGATPAGKGVLGVIPGSMGDPTYVVVGKGNEDSLRSAAHGAGRRMSRTQARKQFSLADTRRELKRRGITILSAGADEVPGVYKNIREVMAQQTDLVDVVAEFSPRIVKMCDDGSRPED